MAFFASFLRLLTPQDRKGTDQNDDLVGSFFDDIIDGKDDDDRIFGLFGDDVLDGGDGNDELFGGFGHDTLNGGNGEDTLKGGFGKDRLVGNKGNDRMFGGFGDDLLVWNNGDGSDLMVGGRGDDRVQVNFDTDLVNDDLQNKDVAEFSVTDEGVQFARVELNDQAVNGLFQLDIRETEVLETNFGGGDDVARIVGTVLDGIKLDLDGGDGEDTLNFSRAAAAVTVDLAAGTAGTASVENFENIVGTEFDDILTGDENANVISGLGGVDSIFGGDGDDILIANKGNDFVFGGDGKDLLVWNNGDGSDLLDGGDGFDAVQVNFNTDLVNVDLQNKDVAEFSVTDEGVQFARIELNDQAVNGLFQLDIRRTEELETNFGGGDDRAEIVDDVLDRILIDLDGGEGTDLLDLSRADASVEVDLEAGTVGTGTVTNFEDVTGTDFNDVIIGDAGNNVIRGGAGNDVLAGGDGADSFVFFQEDAGIDIILDFDVDEDRLIFATDEGLTAADLLGELEQTGDDVALEVNGKLITFEDTQISDFQEATFLIV